MSKEDEKQEKARTWRVGIVEATHSRSSRISRPMDAEAAVRALAKLSDALPAGVRAFAFASGPDEGFDDAVAIAVVNTIADLANQDAPSDIYGDWYGYDVLGSIRFDEESRAARLGRAERENARLRRETDWQRRRLVRLRGWALSLSALFLALSIACAWMAFRGKPALEHQPQQRDKNGHQQAVAARGETGEDPALLAGSLLGVEGFETGVRERAERNAGRGAAKGADDAAADELRVDERGGDLERGGVGAVGKLSLAGLGAENAEFDVVHAPGV